MNFYDSSFLLIISCCGLLTYRQYTTTPTAEHTQKRNSLIQKQNGPSAVQKAEASRFTRLFLTVYSLVMASDWLQGPYVYSLYKDQFELRETIVAALFTTGFLSGGISGYFVGQFADRYGRKTACLSFCLTYSIACFSTLIPHIGALFFGRIFGGISTSLMYSAFESWMVTEYHKRQLGRTGMSLSSMFGIMTTMNSIVAIISGVFSEWLVRVTETKRSPFMASAALLSVAFLIIWRFWTENYGDSASSSTSTPSSPGAKGNKKNVLAVVLADKRILILGLASCFFEGSMYLFVFFWTPALKAAQSQSLTSTPHENPIPSLPLGTIFACFMGSVMLGSLLFNHLVSRTHLISHARLLTIIFSTASSSLLVTVTGKNEILTFASFCVFEACVGMYWPSVGYLKGRVIEDAVRARVYGILRIPLNVFVVVALGLIKEGEGYRNQVFMTCSGLLLGVGGIFQWIVTE